FLVKFVMFSLIFFFGEIAFSFSDKVTSNSTIRDENISFALNLENSYSDFDYTRQVDILMHSFMNSFQVKGASVAITRNDSLVYAKGFGMANEETGEHVQPGHLFRIASVSKLITAVAILKLYEQDSLDLDETVFGPKGILNDMKFLNYKDKRVEKITIRDLLNHTGGWSRYKGDPMFNSLYIARKMDSDPPADLDMIIRYVLEKPLSFEPGTTYSYSNFGYALLGKIIQEKTGMPYEDYVVMNILKPVGINDMHIGQSHYYEKFPNEVRYYEPAGSSNAPEFNGSGRMVPKAYGGNNMELLSAAGGWVASAPELARFITVIDGCPDTPDILKPETIDMMTDPMQAGEGLFGWRGSDKHGTWWRTGTLAGTTALIIKLGNGLTWTVLLNTSSYKRLRIHHNLARTIFAATYRMNQWPEQNLFAMKRAPKANPISEIPSLNPEL
ncbi:MAG TPA: serine hydrolase domain-containing protein, partial [Bacteroidales bacterium]|nr:serine hydrolase domain-containing protein [Bacteroidales bacterium]